MSSSANRAVCPHAPFLSCLAALFVFLGLCLPAQATVFPAHGGKGDRAEECLCPQGQVLVGFHGRTGSWIDQIGLICAPFAPPAYARGALRRQQPRGGNGGGTNEQYCIADAAIRQVTVRMLGEYRGIRKYVWSIDFSCFRPRDGSAANAGAFRGDIQGKGVDLTADDFAAQRCPGNEYAIGLNIRYGEHVNAAGLICGQVDSASTPYGAGNVSGAGNVPGVAPGMENNVDRPGSDIHRFELQDGSPSACQARCNRLGRCKAWTYVRPGIQGPQAVCYLKDSVSAPVSNACCISGVKEQGAPSVPDEPRAEAQTQLPRCRPGFVWREARATDFVCVTPESRSLATRENATASSRIDPNGQWGPFSCVSGFVWREAFDGDTVCVTPERRAAVREENQLGPSRTE